MVKTQTASDVLTVQAGARREHKIPCEAGRGSVIGDRSVSLSGSTKPRLVEGRRQESWGTVGGPTGSETSETEFQGQ